MQGLIIKSTGSWYTVKTDEGILDARLRGRFKLEDKKITNPIAVGDKVTLVKNEGGQNEWVIEEILPRENYIIRKSPRKKNHDHLIAANVDQAVLIVTLKRPKTSFGFIDRFLVTLEAFRIPGVIIFNKRDLLNQDEIEEVLYAMYRYDKIGYQCVLTSFTEDGLSEDLMKLLRGRVSLVSGHSGTGKSTMINLLLPNVEQKVSEISDFANKGVHTTTFAEMFFFDEDSAIIDTPGIKELGLAEIEAEELAHYFPEMRNHLGECRFHNCIHVNEPGCAVLAEVENGNISGERYLSYLSMLEGEDNRR
ncbi:ribosome small subunit-dependent GTPase A [Marinoscillum sp. MHG1-6]|uniref:ribosome small subunit-dependent GTPase A n=1 Tax=Marinoscillum sp. MHG1-6 TaxID=2959627 RepID=UPI0021572DD2|nr:ribosome small subunit-dependent GTPase A [Marinoscillum sp. MHG1-6]